MLLAQACVSAQIFQCAPFEIVQEGSKTHPFSSKLNETPTLPALEHWGGGSLQCSPRRLSLVLLLCVRHPKIPSQSLNVLSHALCCLLQ